MVHFLRRFPFFALPLFAACASTPSAEEAKQPISISEANAQESSHSVEENTEQSASANTTSESHPPETYPEPVADTLTAPRVGPAGSHESHIGLYLNEAMPLEPRNPLPSPIRRPSVNAKGCTTKGLEYSERLEAHRKATREAELQKFGATSVPVIVRYLRNGDSPRMEYVRKGERFVSAGEVVRIGNKLHTVKDEARTFRVPSVVVCGKSPCPHGSGMGPPYAGHRGSGAIPRRQEQVVRVQIGESFGDPLVLHYDAWRASVEYSEPRHCGPPPA